MSFNKMVNSEQQELITLILYDLKYRVLDNLDSIESNGLFNGLAGHLLFLFHFQRFNSNSISQKLFDCKLDDIVNDLDPYEYDLCNGLAGKLWFLEYVSQFDQENYDSDTLIEFDAFFSSILNTQPWRGEIEVVLGLAGFIPYIKRRHNYSDQSVLLELFFNQLETLSEKDNNNLFTWCQPSNSLFISNKETSKEYNLGFAHGVPGIIMALLPSLDIPYLKSKSTRLVLGACNWLVSQKKENKDSTSYFSYYVGDTSDSRLGWCYGDLTIALTLLRVGKKLDNTELINEAKNIAYKASLRDVEEAGVKDAGVCHGSVGILFIFMLIHKESPDQRIKQTIEYWLDYILKSYKKNGIDALLECAEFNNKSTGLLTGCSGIGLALLSLLTNEFSWSESILLY